MRIILSGSVGTGKTTFLRRLHKELGFKGFNKGNRHGSNIESLSYPMRQTYLELKSQSYLTYSYGLNCVLDRFPPDFLYWRYFTQNHGQLREVILKAIKPEMSITNDIIVLPPEPTKEFFLHYTSDFEDGIRNSGIFNTVKLFDWEYAIEPWIQWCRTYRKFITQTFPEFKIIYEDIQCKNVEEWRSAWQEKYYSLIKTEMEQKHEKLQL